MRRRTFLRGATALASVGAVAGLAWHRWLDGSPFNACYRGALPAHLADHELIRQAFDGIDTERLWDNHVHLIGDQSGGNGAFVNPAMLSWMHPIQHVQYLFYRNGACIAGDNDLDRQYVDRLVELMQHFPPGAKLMLLAFDHYHDAQGQPDPSQSTFYTPNAYAAALAQRYPQHFVWVASIHPYREDCVEALNQAVAQGAKALKWLPPAMGIDPSSPRCDRFYAALARHDLPLVTHAGHEKAVHSEELQHLGNPLHLRRALDHGVRVVVSHLASLGDGIDLDAGGKNARKLDNFTLFARLFEQRDYQGRLFGELSAVAQINRIGPALAEIVRREAWHDRLINGSDYPLPAIPPVFSLKVIRRLGWITPVQAGMLNELRHWNPLLFDFVLKRCLRVDGKALPPKVFHTRSFFDRSPG